MGDEKKTGISITIDLKDIVIVLLILFCIFLYFNPFKSSSIKDLEESIDLKDKEIKKIELERDSLKRERNKIDSKIDSVERIYQNRKDTIQNLKNISKSQKQQINELRSDIDMFNKMLQENEKKIISIKKNPIVLPKDKILKKITEKL
jgi:peptidoglycan hydrolase CwlO-like protein